MSIYNNLTKVTVIHAIDDGGPGGATCPHCGAIGRWVVRFSCEGESELRGAMRGCFSKFNVSKLAWRHYELMMKEAEKGSLNSWETKEVQAIQKYAAGEIAEWQALDEIKQQQNIRNAWMRRQGYRR